MRKILLGLMAAAAIAAPIATATAANAATAPGTRTEPRVMGATYGHHAWTYTCARNGQSPA